MRRSAVLHSCVLNNLLLHFYWSAIVSQDVFFFLFCFDRVRACVFTICSSGGLMSRPPASLRAVAVAGRFWWHAWKLFSCFITGGGGCCSLFCFSVQQSVILLSRFCDGQFAQSKHDLVKCWVGGVNPFNWIDLWSWVKPFSCFVLLLFYFSFT